MTILLGSSAASPTSSNGSPPWNPRLAEAGRELSAALAGVAFTFNGVLTEGGKIYGYAANSSGQQLRWVLRRER